MTGSLPLDQVFTFLFLMLGPFKIIGPFAKLTHGADPRLTRRIVLAAVFISSLALLLAAVVGETILDRFHIELPVLTLAAGIILFLVALQGTLQQFSHPDPVQTPATPPAMRVAITPLAFPTIVTPYGIAALIVFMAVSPDNTYKLKVGGILLAIMLVNLVVMLLARYILKWLGVALQIVGAVLGIIQVALGLGIIIGSLKKISGA
jgi:multiple antibiotic resistance protein